MICRLNLERVLGRLSNQYFKERPIYTIYTYYSGRFPKWADWSESTLEEYINYTTLYINPIIYSEIFIGFKLIEDLESAITKTGFQILEIPKEALFLAGKAYLKYKKRKGVKRTPLPDFYIGAQAAVLNSNLITRDVSRYRSYFPIVKLITP